MYAKGTIVLIPFPFTDLSGNKVRPAVVLFHDKKSADMVVIFITSNIQKRGIFDVLIQPTKSNGIKVASKIVCDKIASLDKKIVIGTIGECDGKTMKEVSKKLKQLLSL